MKQAHRTRHATLIRTGAITGAIVVERWSTPGITVTDAVPASHASAIIAPRLARIEGATTRATVTHRRPSTFKAGSILECQLPDGRWYAMAPRRDVTSLACSTREALDGWTPDIENDGTYQPALGPTRPVGRRFGSLKPFRR